MADKPAADGIWIFVSHSNLDFAKVKLIRDELEKEGHKPLLFFLKCLDEKDPRLPQLIRDEIKARTWFVLCNSDNAKNSPWVQEEIRIVETTKPKETFVSIDLKWDLDVIMSEIRPLLRRATVFLSYDRRDVDIANQIYDALLEQDYSVFFDRKSLKAFESWEHATHNALEDAVKNGFVLLLLSPDYLTSPGRKAERESAFEMLGSKLISNVVPVIVRDPAAVFLRLPPDLRELQCVDVTRGSAAENVARLLRDLKSRRMA
jgi:hypothetical protein